MRIDTTAFREMDKCQLDSGLLLKRPRPMVTIQRLPVAKTRQRSSIHQSLRTWYHGWLLVYLPGSSISQFGCADELLRNWLCWDDSRLEGKPQLVSIDDQYFKFRQSSWLVPSRGVESAVVDCNVDGCEVEIDMLVEIASCWSAEMEGTLLHYICMLPGSVDQHDATD